MGWSDSIAGRVFIFYMADPGEIPGILSSARHGLKIKHKANLSSYTQGGPSKIVTI